MQFAIKCLIGIALLVSPCAYDSDIAITHTAHIRVDNSRASLHQIAGAWFDS
ncbi:hypothetical protein N8E89_22400 (plasmid) [Phyllobacterium sp. A18/5-2]|uniref:hypothetical protein n=1 Tax=Phyllobacterium sp. A18/5-2 TaxID=2978392 RepID=UPI0021C689C9|nr:hypothetical protein [Phyllobacterium sp. A18/5-2]UXN66005.1 hypothetical protein N8E89_22400 [Phyllobacterium sp. A18/5-2]